MTTSNDVTEPVFEIRSLLADALTYPVDLPEVQERLGNAVVEAPGRDVSVTLDDVLAHRPADETFDSADGLFLAVLNGLPEQYVGRKFQSGRGVVIDEFYDGDGDRLPESF